MSHLTQYDKDPKVTYQYGTAGFRYSNEILDSVMYRMGALAVIRSCSFTPIGTAKDTHQPYIGVMDNGVKLVDPQGEMLASEWEQTATDLANVSNELLSNMLVKLSSDFSNSDALDTGNVIVARDTRFSGQRLVDACKAGVERKNGNVIDAGELTTPQLHYLVKCLNTRHLKHSYGLATEDGYYDKLTVAYKRIVGDAKCTQLTVDCANGVGAPKLKSLIDRMGGHLSHITIVNDMIREKGVLNEKCGADYVKVEQRASTGISDQQSTGRCCSYDGDADRIVYYFSDSASKKFHLIDGDKIAALAAGYFAELIDGISVLKGTIEIGVVQTAYANGSSTKYFKENSIPTACTETGVKNLHHRAAEYGIGVYFEANGHGTVVFHSNTIKALETVDESKLNVKGEGNLNILRAFIDMINQTVGDAISDMLTVEAILIKRQWTLEDWATKLYQDLPNRQLKVKVSNRGAFITTDADRKLVKPDGLQAAVDELIKKAKQGRAFVRPSGTEDVVRVYAEAATTEECETLAWAVAGVVFDLGGGLGDRPVRK